MKNIKKLIVFTLMAISTVSISAKKSLPNKDQVFFTNEYGADVAIALTWEGKGMFSFSVEEDHIVKSHHKELMFKGPYSGYHLAKIDATPAANLEGKDLVNIAINGAGLFADLTMNQTEEERKQSRKLTDAASGAAEVGYAISKSLNNDQIKVRGDKFFVLERGHEKSKISSQKKIRIKEYANKEHYEKEIAKVEAKTPEVVAAVVDEQASKKDVTKENLEFEQKKIALQLEQLALEEKQLAFKEKQLAFEKNNSAAMAEGIAAVAAA